MNLYIKIFTDQAQEQTESKSHVVRIGIATENRRRVGEHDERSHDDQDQVQSGTAGAEGREGVRPGREEGAEERDRHHGRNVRQAEPACSARRRGDVALYSGLATQTGTVREKNMDERFWYNNANIR